MAPKQATKAPAAAKATGATKKTVAKASPAAKATKVAQKVRGEITKKRVSKVRTSVHFRRPHTLRLPRDPKYPRRAMPRRNKFDQYRILKHPLTTEAAMKMIEDKNTLVFITDIQATKKDIRRSIKKMYDVKVESVNTLIRPDGQKKAFIKLTGDFDALDVANKIGII
eukprot:GEZU01042118.1.p2 GENE.GEZU01042118.1~~GEZU01042118.1.p2  ORF type:complete len:168 (-),score=70.86 GEZU01042118.1:74-577(-)